MIVVISVVIETETMVSLGSEMREDVILNLDMVVKALLCPGSANTGQRIALVARSPRWYAAARSFWSSGSGAELRGRLPKPTRSRWWVWRVAAAGCSPADAARGATTGQARTTCSPEPAPEASNERLRDSYLLAGPSPPLDPMPANRWRLIVETAG